MKADLIHVAPTMLPTDGRFPFVPYVDETEEELSGSVESGLDRRAALKASWEEPGYGWSEFLQDDLEDALVEGWALPKLDPYDVVQAIGRATRFAVLLVECSESAYRVPTAEDDLYLGYGVRRARRRDANGNLVRRSRPNDKDACLVDAFVALGYLPPAALALRLASSGNVGDLAYVVRQSIAAVVTGL